ncbi:hypothetical protein GF326_10005 [Candidatus Bathyarchaeota archaeon]|nr:hypothetical protein [Candidatus Bathyarchaeota archaeon]
MNNKTKTTLILALLLTITAATQIISVEAQTPIITVNPSPPRINADGEIHQITIELKTANDQPYIAPRDTPIHITSSNLNLGTIDEFTTVKEGESYAKAAFTTKKTSGITLITASSPGYTTGSEYLQVHTTNINARLNVHTSPSSQPAVVGEKGKIVVQIVDNIQNPITATEDVQVTLTSSNHRICTVEQELVIPSGENYATAEFTVIGSNPGEVVISAQAQGYVPGNDIVTTYNITESREKVTLYFSPDILLPDQETHEAITIQLQNKDGKPVPATTTTTIYLSSSNTNIATVENPVTINTGEYKTTATLNTYTMNGETIISASSSDLLSDSKPITVEGQQPSILELYIYPNVLIADGTRNEIITVQLQDDNGNPVTAKTDTQIRLTSTNPNIGTVPGSLTIPLGKSYTTAPLNSTTTPGQINILASMMGATPSEKSLQTITKKFNMSLETPNIISINQTFTISVQLDSHGLPVEGADIEWTALGGVIQSEESKTDENGVASAQIVQKYETLRLKSVASKTGFESEEVQKNIQIAQEVDSDELTVTVLGREILVFHILIALATVIALVLGAYVYLKYRASKEEEPEDLEIF